MFKKAMTQEIIKQELSELHDKIKAVLEEQYKEVIAKYERLKNEFISLQQDYAKILQENLILKARIKELEAENLEQENSKVNKYSELANKLFNE